MRLTLLYSAILALTLIGFGGVLYLTISQVGVNLVKNTLAEEAKRLVETKEFRLDNVDFPASKVAAPQTYVQTRDANGAVLDQSPNLRANDFTLPLSETALQTVRQGQSSTETAATNSGRLLIYNKPVTKNGQVIGILQVARPLTEQDQSLNTLGMILLIGGVVVLLVACGIGWLLAGAALRPIHRLTRTAQAIGQERDFARRVDYRRPPDEVGHLAATFNTMLTELEAAYRQTQQTLQAQRRFVADASHELRNPLTTIRGNLALLQREPPISEPDRRAALADMVEETERMSRLVSDLLLLARADAGQPLRRGSVPLKPLVEELCRQVRLLDPDRPLDCESVADVAVLGDRDALKQVLINLLDNARKFTPAGRAVRVSTSLAGGRVAIHIEDSGPGIPDAELAHIFERFYRSDATRTGGGAGLGLAIAKTLTEVQQGTIAVESRVGQGSTFSVTLPLAPVPPEPATHPAHGEGARTRV